MRTSSCKTSGHAVSPGEGAEADEASAAARYSPCAAKQKDCKAMEGGREDGVRTAADRPGLPASVRRQERRRLRRVRT